MPMTTDQITMLAHVMGGMGENISAGNPAFSGVPQSMIKAQNMASLLNRLGGGTPGGGTTKGGVPADNNPNTPEKPEQLGINFKGSAKPITDILQALSFGPSDVTSQAMTGIGFTNAPNTALDPTNPHMKPFLSAPNTSGTRGTTFADERESFTKAIGGLPF